MGIKVDETLLKRASNLKIVSSYGVGYDNIDIKASQQYGVVVTNTPQSTTNPTANHTIGLMLSLMRRIAEHNQKLKSGQLKSWYGRHVLGTSIEGKTLGIIGLGRIGRAVAYRAKTLGMSIVYFNRNRLMANDAKKLNAKFVSLPELLKVSDVVTVHAPLTRESRGMIGFNELKIMKREAFIINTARGGIIDEEALIECLKSERISGAALDVFENEPQPRNEFFHLENVVLTPHNGTGTHEARAAMMKEALGNIMAYLTDKEMTSRVV
jgi:D-3-phosphoglycerate dehydrogenase